MAPQGLAQEKTSVCINTAGQNVIRTISLLALLPGLSHCLEQAKALWFVSWAPPALEQVWEALWCEGATASKQVVHPFTQLEIC